MPYVYYSWTSSLKVVDSDDSVHLWRVSSSHTLPKMALRDRCAIVEDAGGSQLEIEPVLTSSDPKLKAGSACATSAELLERTPVASIGRFLTLSEETQLGLVGKCY